MVEPVCNRCGKCCWYFDVNGRYVPCKHLVFLSKDTTVCRVWKARNDALRYGKPISISPTQRCVNRKDSKFDFPGCPYNTTKLIRFVSKDKTDFPEVNEDGSMR
jgi:hypothetical protein